MRDEAANETPLSPREAEQMDQRKREGNGGIKKKYLRPDACWPGCVQTGPLKRAVLG